MNGEFPFDLYRKRIQRCKSHLQKGELLLLFGASHQVRNRDVEYKFRQNSDFFYLTGIEEADSIFFATRDSAGMFCLPKEKEKEIWTGVRLGAPKIKKLLDLDETYDLTAWESKLEKLLLNHHTLCYFFGENSERDKFILGCTARVGQKAREGKFAPDCIRHPSFLHEWRRIKAPEEVQKIEEAARITELGHKRLFLESREGQREYHLKSILEGEYLRGGAWGGGYNHIVAAGKNACVLHYTESMAPLKKGDLVLVDSGAEKDYYTADVTRVFPVQSKFTEPQKMIYEVVLQAQKNAIEICKRGTSLLEIHKKTVHFLVDVLREMGFLSGSLDKILEEETYKKFYMHRTGHYLGMDVHDVGKYYESGKPLPLEDGQIITVEPGLYFDPEDETIPREFRGIGIRIEDDVLIQGQKPVNLTKAIPKEISEIEELRKQALSG